MTRSGQNKEPRTRNRTEANMDESMKAFNKGQNTGTMFRLDMDVLKTNKINAESYVRIWITAWHNKLTNTELEIAKKHQILWFGQSAVTPVGYPPLGVPANKNQLILVAATGRCGQVHVGCTALNNGEELELLSNISGDVITDATQYYQQATDIRVAMDKFRHNATVALGPKLSGPFDQGILTSYSQLIKWVYKKCNVTRTIESMADYFEDLDKAINDDNDTDCKILKYRMALNKMYQKGTKDQPIKFPDLEDDPIQWSKTEEYSPILSLMFLYITWKKMDKKTWTAIEDEFRGEIGGTNYNKASWMANKPRLFELIDQKSKSTSSRASVNRVQADDESDDDRMEIEIEPGMIMYISPKGPKNKRPQNWKSKVQKFNAAARRGQKSGNSNTNSNMNRNNWNNKEPATYWNCKVCPQDRNGQHTRHKRGQKCPKTGFIPKRMIAMVQQGEDESDKVNEDQEDNDIEPEGIKSVRPKIAPMRQKFQYDSSSEDQSE